MQQVTATIVAVAMILATGNATSAEPPKERTNSIGMKFKLVPAALFKMGSSLSAKELAMKFGGRRELYEDELPQHEVQIPRPFHIGTTEVTQEQYVTIMSDRPWNKSKSFGTYGKRGPIWDAKNYPAYDITWDEAVEFCVRLSEREVREYRLPTEAEWEYSCRANTTTIWCCGNDEKKLHEFACFDSHSEERYGMPVDPLDIPPPPTMIRVAQKRPNAWGLFDMHGNVSEWCSDWYGWDYYVNSSRVDPVGPTGGKNMPWGKRRGREPRRVIRGGNWFYGASVCRSAERGAGMMITPGFRVVLELPK